MKDSPHILVIGAGSAGRRHARNLRGLGCAISVVDPRQDRLKEAAGEGELRRAYTGLEEALAGPAYDGFVIASPPAFHVDQALAAGKARDRWILCEKPLSLDAAQGRRLLPGARRLLLAYTYRWWPPVIDFRRRLLAGEIGTVRLMRFVMSAHLADWHPWEPYQDFFMADGRAGGGALLDESHFIDLMLWMLGWPKSVCAQVDKISRLEISADDNVDILVSYEGARVNLHLDLIGRPHERSITAVGDLGTLAYVYEENAVKRWSHDAKEWARQPYACERNEMFLGADRELLARIQGAEASPLTCSVQEGVDALTIVDACRESSSAGKTVKLPKRRP